MAGHDYKYYRAKLQEARSMQDEEEILPTLEDIPGPETFEYTPLVTDKPSTRMLEIESTIDEVVKDFGRIDCFVANAGTANSKPILEMSLEEYHALTNRHIVVVQPSTQKQHIVPELSNNMRLSDQFLSLLLVGFHLFQDFTAASVSFYNRTVISRHYF